MKKRLLFVIESLSGGGAEKVLSTTLGHLDQEKFDITLCCVVNTGKYQETLPSHIHYRYLIDTSRNSRASKLAYKLKYKLIYDILPLSWVSSYLKPNNFDTIIAYVEGFATKLVSHAKGNNLKKIAWVHTDLKSNHWTQSIFLKTGEEQRCYNQYDEIVTVSNTALVSFKEIFPQCTRPIRTLYNPIDSKEITKLSEQPLDIIEKNSIRIVSVGRLAKQKSYDRLLRIFNRLIQENYPIELWLIGDGPKRNAITSFVNDNHLNERVKLLGFQKNPYKYMKRCDLFVCSSLSEGYSTAVTEALILGIPVITTLCSGMEELLNYGEFGIITENSEEGLCHGLKSLLDNRHLFEHYQQKAIERGGDFSVKNLISQVEDFLLQSL